MRLNWPCVALLITGSIGSVQSVDHVAVAQPADVTEERTFSPGRLRMSVTTLKFNLADKGFDASGPEFGYERALNPRFNAGASLGQAYTADGKYNTLFTSIDLSFWYSVIGTFTQERRIYRSGGAIIGDYQDRRTGGLRVGLGTQQYFFNMSSGTIPYSGLSLKAMYEFGFNWSFDLAMGLDTARLTNAKGAASADRLFVSLVLPLGQ